MIKRPQAVKQRSAKGAAAASSVRAVTGKQPENAASERCRQCRCTNTERKMFIAVGEVMGVGRSVPLRVELLCCKDCDDLEFTGTWSVASAERGEVLRGTQNPKMGRPK